MKSIISLLSIIETSSCVVKLGLLGGERLLTDRLTGGGGGAQSNGAAEIASVSVTGYHKRQSTCVNNSTVPSADRRRHSCYVIKTVRVTGQRPPAARLQRLLPLRSLADTPVSQGKRVYCVHVHQFMTDCKLCGWGARFSMQCVR